MTVRLPPRLAAAPDDDRIYRLEAFGPFRRNPSVPTDPALFLLFRREDPETGQMLDEWVERIGVVSLIPQLYLHSRWQHQRRIEDPRTWTIRTFDVLISDATVVPITLGHKLDNNQYLFPYRLLKAGGTHWNRVRTSRFLAVDVGTVKGRLILPAPTLVASHIAPSSRLVQMLFDGTFERPSWPSRVFAEVERDGPRVVVKPASAFGRSDTIALVRMLCEPRALNAARLVSSEYPLTEPFRAQDPDVRFPDIRAAFPFEGRSRLRVLGRFFVDGADARRFLAVRVLSCTGPLPFDELVIEHEEQLKTPSPGTSEIRQRTASAKEDDDADAIIVNQAEPDRDARTRTDLIPATVFEDAKGKVRFERTEGYVLRARKAKLGSSTENNTYSTGAGQDPNSTHARYRMVGEEESPRDLMGDLLRMLEQLAADGFPWKPILLNVPKEKPDGMYSHFPATVNGRDHPWSLVAVSAVERRPRRALVAEVDTGQRILYLIETERRPSESFQMLAASVPNRLAPRELSSALELGVENQGVWNRRLKASGWLWKTVRHSAPGEIDAMRSALRHHGFLP